MVVMIISTVEFNRLIEVVVVLWKWAWCSDVTLVIVDALDLHVYC